MIPKSKKMTLSSKIARILCVTALCLISASCSEGEYKVTDDSVIYTYWTFSFGQVEYELPNADPESFKAVKNWLGHDKNHVFFKDKLIKGADPQTIKADKYPLSHDKKDYYYESVAIHVADPANFKIIHQDEFTLWAKDSKFVYFDSIRIAGSDPASFKLKEYNVGIDKNHVYRYGKILENADPKTYDTINSYFYSKDKSHVWYMDEVIEGADIATFKVDKDGTASDKNGTYFGSRLEYTETGTAQQPAEEQ